MSKRFDLVRLDKGELTPQGFFKAPATFTRTGVFTYLDKSGNARRELRHPDDVFDPASLRSLQMAPLTFKHPEKFVDSENVRDLATGYIGDNIGTRDGKYVNGMVLITDKNAIAEAESGTVELSCGYTADMIDEAGEYEGMPYDCRQTNIRYNHVAQVEAGRAGPLVRLHLDADDRVQVATPKETQMNKVTINGKEFDVPPEVAAYIGELEAGDETLDSKLKEKDADIAKKGEELDKAKEDAATAAAAVAEAKKSADTLQAKVDSLEQKLTQKEDSVMTSEQINGAVRARMKIQKVAESVLGGEFKEDSSDLELMKAVVAKRSSVKLDGKSADYVQASFDIIAEETAKRADAHEEVNARFSAPRTDADYDLKSARQKQTQDASDGWKQPLAASKK